MIGADDTGAVPRARRPRLPQATPSGDAGPPQPNHAACPSNERRRRANRYSYYTVVQMARRSKIPKSQPFSIRLGEQADLLVRDEVRRSGRSRSVVVEELAEEAAKTRLFPGVAFRGTPRRAWVIGTGLDVWEIVELLRSYEDDERKLRAAHPLVDERHLRLARAYAARFPDEIAAFVEDARRPLDELRRSYPFLQTAE